MSHRAASTTDPLAWLRDAVQARLLAHLFTNQVHDLVLKGGMAMRIAHGNQRATQDIDLDADARVSMESIKTQVRRAVRGATRSLLSDVVITEPKQTDTTARWKIAGSDPATGMRLHVTVEVSHREAIPASDLRALPSQTAAPGDPPIVLYTDQALAFKKVKALLADNRSALRDVLDLSLLIRASVDPPIAHLRRWLRGTPAQNIRTLWDKLESMDEHRFRTEVLPALPEHRSTSDWTSDWDAVRLAVGQAVQGWLQQAEEPEEASVSSSPRMAL